MQREALAVKKEVAASDPALAETLKQLLATVVDTADALTQRDAQLVEFARTAPAAWRFEAASAVQDRMALEELTRRFVDKDRRIYKLAKERLAALAQAERKAHTLAALQLAYQAVLEADVVEVSRFVEVDHQLDAANKRFPLSAEEGAALAQLREQIQARLVAQADAQRTWVQVRERLQGLKAKAPEMAAQEVLAQLAEALAQAGGLTPGPVTVRIGREIDALALQLQTSTQQRIDQAERLAAREALVHQARGLNVERIGQSDLDDLQARWRALPPLDHATVELAERFSNALKNAKEGMLAAQAAQQEKGLAAKAFFDEVVEQLASALHDGHAQQAIKLHDRIRARMDDLRFAPAPVSRRIHALLEEAGKLKGWQQFTNVNKRDELIERAEKIAAHPLPGDLQEAEIKDLQDAWKALDKELGGASDKLWDRFRGATGKAFDAVRAHKKAQARLRDANAANKQDQIRQLKDLLAQVDWNTVDWKAVEQLRREAWAAWKSAGPINRKVQETLSAEHSAVMKELDERLDGARQRERARRAKLTGDANALAAGDGRDALDRLKVLQERWTSERVGVFLGRKEEDESWQTFRAACQAVYARRDQKKQEFLGELEANQTAKLALLARLTALQADPALVADAKGLAYQLRTLQAEWDAIGTVPKARVADIASQWRTGLDAVKHRLAHAQGAADRARLAAAREQGMTSRATADSAQQQAKMDALLDLEIAAQVDSPAEFKDARLKRQVAMLAKSFHGEREGGAGLASRITAWHQLPGGDEAMDARLAVVLAKAGLA